MFSEMLRAVRLTGAVFLSARFTAPFGLVSPKRFDERMPMAHLRHISIFHLIAAGGCMIETASGAAAPGRSRRPASAAVRRSSTSS